MTAVIRAEREGERGRGRVRRLRLFVSRLSVAAALFLEGRADPHRDQNGRSAGTRWTGAKTTSLIGAGQGAGKTGMARQAMTASNSCRIWPTA